MTESDQGRCPGESLIVTDNIVEEENPFHNSVCKNASCVKSKSSKLKRGRFAGAKPFICSKCREKCPVDGNLLAYLKTIPHSKPFQCQNCYLKLAPNYKCNPCSNLQM